VCTIVYGKHDVPVWSIEAAFYPPVGDCRFLQNVCT